MTQVKDFGFAAYLMMVQKVPCIIEDKKIYFDISDVTINKYNQDYIISDFFRFNSNLKFIVSNFKKVS